MGYSSKTCHHVVFGPRRYVSIGARDLVTKRGVQQTLMFVKHIRLDQDLSKLLCIGLEWFQLHAGIARPILECPSLDIPYLEVRWFMTSENSYASLIQKSMLIISVYHMHSEKTTKL